MRVDFLIVFTLLNLLVAVYAFNDPDWSGVHENRYRALASEVRCLVCQNQTVLDSDAGLAGDLRRELKRLIVENKTDGEIKTFLTERYGDFVLYKPPLKASTAFLWFGPLVFFLLTLGVVFLVIKNAGHHPEEINEQSVK